LFWLRRHIKVGNSRRAPSPCPLPRWGRGCPKDG
jgi:hypothetical protein